MEVTKGPSVGLTLAQKQAAKSRKLDFDLHVALIMRTEGENKNAASFRAYCEGEEGLKTRLSPATEAPKRA